MSAGCTAPLMSCETTEQYSRNVTRRFVGWQAVSINVVSARRPDNNSIDYCNSLHWQPWLLHSVKPGNIQPVAGIIEWSTVQSAQSQIIIRSHLHYRDNPLTPTVAIWVQLLIKYPVPHQVKPVICNFWHPGTLTLTAERQSAQMSKITNDDLTRSRTGCFIAVPIWP